MATVKMVVNPETPICCYSVKRNKLQIALLCHVAKFVGKLDTRLRSRQSCSELCSFLLSLNTIRSHGISPEHPCLCKMMGQFPVGGKNRLFLSFPESFYMLGLRVRVTCF